MLEGGGQILRNAAALSAMTATPIDVTKIKAGRSKPGLRAQHLAGLQLVAELCQGHFEGGAVGSQEIKLTPKRITSGYHLADTKTAGSCMLLAQARATIFNHTPHCTKQNSLIGFACSFVPIRLASHQMPGRSKHVSQSQSAIQASTAPSPDPALCISSLLYLTQRAWTACKCTRSCTYIVAKYVIHRLHVQDLCSRNTTVSKPRLLCHAPGYFTRPAYTTTKLDERSCHGHTNRNKSFCLLHKYCRYHFCFAMQQAALPCLLIAQPSQHPEPATPAANTSVLDLRGGTDAAMAPPVGYVQHVLLPMLHRLQSVDARIHLHRRGFFPKVCGQKMIKRAVNSKSLEARMLLFNLHWARVYVVNA